MVEAGGGESEGAEQTEAELIEAAEPTAPGMSPEQGQIEDTIQQAPNPSEGETPEPSTPPDDGEFRTWSGRSL